MWIRAANRTGTLRLVGSSEQWGKLRDIQKCAPRQLLVIRGSSMRQNLIRPDEVGPHEIGARVWASCVRQAEFLHPILCGRTAQGSLRASVLLETHCYARPPDRRNCTLTKFPAPISCRPTSSGSLCESGLLETHCYARPSNRKNITLSECPAHISCGPTKRGLIRSNEILTHTSAKNVDGF